MRQAMDRHSRPSTSPTSSGAPRTAYIGGTSGGQGASSESSETRRTASVRSTRRARAPAARRTRRRPHRPVWSQAAGASRLGNRRTRRRRATRTRRRPSGGRHDHRVRRSNEWPTRNCAATASARSTPRTDRVARPPQVFIIAASLAGAVVLLRSLPAGAGVLPAFSSSSLRPSILLLADRRPVCRGVAARSPSGTCAQRATRAGSHRSAPHSQASRFEIGGRPEPVVALPEPALGLELLAAPLRGETVGVVKDSARPLLHRGARGEGDLVRSPRSSRAGSPPGRLGRRPREPRPRGKPRDAASSGSSEPSRPTATRSAATSATRGTEAPSRSTRCRCSRTSSSSAPRPPLTKDHELFVCLQIDAKRAWRQIKRAGGKSGAGCGRLRVLLRELEALGERLTAADVQVVGALRPGCSRSAIRVAFDPWSRPGLARLAAADPDRDGIDEGAAWPVASETTWSQYRTDGALHATYWIASWPRTDVGAAFLSPLLLHAQMAAGGRGDDRADLAARWRSARSRPRGRPTSPTSELRGRMGFIETARRRRLAEATLAARGGAGRRPRRGPLLRLRHRLARRRRGARAQLRRGRARRADGTPRAASASTASRTRHSPTRFRSAGGCDEHAAASPGHRTTTAHLQAAYPFVAEGGLGGRGVYIGRDAYGGSFCYDPWELYGRELTSPNAVVIGIVGRAKSSLVKTYVFRQAVFGRQAWIVDVKGEYEPLAEALGVSPIALSPGGGIRLNPLTPRGGPEAPAQPPLLGRRRGARTAAHAGGEARGSGGARACSSARRSTSRRCPSVVDVLLHPTDGDGRRARDAGRELAAGRPRRWRFALQRLCSGNLRGMFDGPTTPGLDLDAPLVVLDLRAVLNTTRPRSGS